MKKMTMLVILALSLMASMAFAEAPLGISYQGLLNTDTGEAVPDGSYNLTFTMYDAASGGTALWTETQSIPVTDGLFNAILGMGNILSMDFDDHYWLGVKVDSDPELTPRVRLTSSAYALNSNRLGGLQPSGYSLSGHAHLLNDLSNVDVAGATEGEVLTYDSGAGDWTASPVPASTDSDWTVLGNNMYSNVSGNVGIGTTAPGTPLHIKKDQNTQTSIRIENTDTGASSGERISFRNEDGDIAGIVCWDDDSSYGNRMSIFNNRPGGNFSLSNSGGGIYLDAAGEVGINESSPSATLDVNGMVKTNTIRVQTGGYSGYVLTSDANGVGTWQAPAAGDDGDWTISGDDLYRIGGSVGIGAPPLRPAPDTSKGDTPGNRIPASTKLMIDAENEGVYSHMVESNTDNDDRAALYGYRNRTVRNDGTGYGATAGNAGVIGANFWGDNYTFGVAGYSYNDYGHSGGVMGASWSGTYWGALGYKDASSGIWGVYTPNNSYTGGDLTVDGQINGKIRSIGNFGSGYAGTAIIADNSNSGGIALWAETSGSDATVVIDQNGTGDMMRGFLNGSLKFRVLNSGTVITPVLQITGGADLAEPFEVMQEEKIQAGALLVIDEENPGKLKLSESEYDGKVAGVVSGAGGVNPGLTLSQDGVFDEGKNLALSGRVYAMADASNGPIQPGDLLTTSGRAGHAMKATDRDRSHGAVIGKAMTSLDEGTGLVLVLVNLQ